VAGQAGVMSKGFEWAGFDAKSSELTETRDAALVLTEQKPILENLGVNIFSVCFLRAKESMVTSSGMTLSPEASQRSSASCQLSVLYIGA